MQGIGSLESLLFVGCGSAEGLHQLQCVYDMYMYIYMYVYVSICKCIMIFTCNSMCMYTYMYMRMYMYMDTDVCRQIDRQTHR